MVADPAVDAIWIGSPNYTRLEVMEEIAHAVISGRGELIGVSCEKPLGRNVGKPARCSNSPARPACSTATSRTRSSPRPSSAARRSSGPGGGPLRPALSGPGGRGAQRSPHALVLGRDAPGRRRSQRHDVPLRRGGPLHADASRRSPRRPDAGQRHRLHELPQVAGAEIRRGPRPTEAAARPIISSGRPRTSPGPSSSTRTRRARP
jgi:hypothetical protein